jgi:hypothetical protein
MWTIIRNERGGAMVTALFFILGLTVMAAIITSIASSEKRVAHNEYTHVRAFNSSDAGSENAINWIRNLPEAPDAANVGVKVIDQGTYTDLEDPNAAHPESNKYQYDIEFDGMRHRPGWSPEYVDFDYTIDSEGASSKESSANIEVQASRLFNLEY